MKVPQFIPWIGEPEYRKLKSCFDTVWITEGPLAKEFHDHLLNLTKARFGVFAPNGTLGLYLGRPAMGIGVGDTVIIPDFTFIGSATAVEMAGATPVFVDVNKKNFQIDLQKADDLITSKTKAIMPVHIYGTMTDMDAVNRFAKKHRLKVIEDAAQAISVFYKGHHAGTLGDVGTFSFFADKTITTGEGGFVVTNDEEIYRSLQYLRNQGRIERGTFIHPEIGYNFRMTDLQCALGLVQINKLDEIIDKKKAIEALYQHYLNKIPQISFFQKEADTNLVPFRVSILCNHAHLLMEYLSKHDIEPRSFFYPLHRQPAFAYLKNNHKFSQRMADEYFPNTLYGYEHGVMLPSFPSITKKQIEYVSNVIGKFYENRQPI